ncbi:hypothetical protein MBOU_05920 [Mycobacterium bourgelatii]|nr:hypothetical protein MBOU_05920 [Mycobacterium bourgelatii]
MRRRRAASADPRLVRHRTPPFHFGTRCHILSSIVITTTPSCRDPMERRTHMDRENENETTTELVTETLVEEVSIDGMCGVY